ncbi:MAG: MarR family winged helix-turn-helix transcriptional regulator [Acidimicrobiia bacterium]
MAEPDWLDADQQRAWRAYLRSHAELVAALNRRLVAADGLSVADYEVLVHLTEAPGQRLRPFELADLMAWEKSRLSHHLARMRGRGLVRRQQCDSDGRGAWTVCTAAGRRAMAGAATGHVADVRRWFVEPVGQRDLAILGDLSERVLAAIADDELAGGLGPPGPRRRPAP